jgi:NAD(P)-dependent dehydrogenase (short-subunit alcohol dehydrogenase family)
MRDSVIKTETAFPDGAALVVGGSGGIGRGICQSLARDGCSVALTYYRNQDVADQVIEDLNVYDVKSSAHAVDLTNRPAVKETIDQIIERYGRIHTIVYSAGADISMSYVADVDPTEWDRTIDIELHGFFNTVKSALDHMRDKGGGSIVAVTSAGIRRHPPLDILSVVPKAGIEALVRGLAREEGRRNIRANSVAPGVIDEGLFDRLRLRVTPQVIEAMKKNTALKRFGSAQEVGDLVSFLCTNRATYITGQHISVDGGYSV